MSSGGARTTAASAPGRASPRAALALTAAVAAATVALAYDNGGYSLAARSTAAVAVWWTILVGLVLGLWPVSRALRGAVAPGLLLAALAGWDLASAAWSASAENAVVEFDRTSLYLGVYLLVVLASGPGRLAGWIDGLAAAIVATAAVGLTSRFFPGSFPGRDRAALLSVAGPRLSFPLGYWNGLGIFAGLAVPLLLYSALAGGRGRRLLCVGCLPVLGVVEYLASSRGAVAATAAGVLVLIAAHPRRLAALGAAAAGALGAGVAAAVVSSRHALVDGPLGSAAARSAGREATVAVLAVCVATALSYEAAAGLAPRLPAPSRSMRRGAIGALVAIAVGAVVVEARSLQSFTKIPAPSTSVGAHLLSGSGSGRWQFWTAALQEFRRHPLQGGGAGSFEAWWARHASFTYFVKDAHSLVFQTLAELGAVGFLLLVGMLGSALAVALRRLRATDGRERAALAGLLGSLTVYLLGAAVDWMWQLTVVTVVGMAILGLLTGPAAAPPRLGERRGDGRRPSIATAALGFGACAIVAAELVVLLAGVELGRSQAAARAGRLGAARAEAVAASRIEPWAGTPYLQLALVEERQGNLGAAHTAIVRSIDRDTADWRLWLVRARIENGLGRFALGARSLARAKALSPLSPLLG